jgi:hypothetical protein
VKGKHLAIGILVTLAVALGFVFWLGLTGGGRESESGRALSASAEQARAQASPPASVTCYDGGTIGQTIADRRVRDELRRRILAGWAQGEGEVAAAARQGRLPSSMPMGADGQIDPKYIQSVIRGDMLPMAEKCYEELLSRKPDAGGRMEMVFKIVGDEQVGGIIEEAEIDGGVAGAFDDPAMETCIRESLLSLAFPPPPKNGWVTVVYPLGLAP